VAGWRGRWVTLYARRSSVMVGRGCCLGVECGPRRRGGLGPSGATQQQGGGGVRDEWVCRQRGGFLGFVSVGHRKRVRHYVSFFFELELALNLVSHEPLPPPRLLLLLSFRPTPRCAH
jgi:hypothetical protein